MPAAASPNLMMVALVRGGGSSVAGSGDCRALIWFKNACGSIAESSDNAAGKGWGTTEALAERYALESCSSVGHGCSITRTICSGN